MGELNGSRNVFKGVDPDFPVTWSTIAYMGLLQVSFRVVNFTGWKVKWKLISP